jgi:hypothetical protein
MNVWTRTKSGIFTGWATASARKRGYPPPTTPGRQSLVFQSRAVRLTEQHQANVVEVPDLLGRQNGHAQAPGPDALRQSRTFELRERLSDDRPADTETRGEVDLNQALAGLDFAGLNQRAISSEMKSEGETSRFRLCSPLAFGLGDEGLGALLKIAPTFSATADCVF